MGLRLDGALAVGLLAHQLGAGELAQALGKQLGAAGRFAVHQHHHGQVHAGVVALAQQGALAGLVFGPDDVAAGHQQVDAVHSGAEQAAGVAAHVKHQRDGALAGEVVHRLAELGEGGGIELGDLDVADGVLHHLVLHAGNDVLAADDGVLRGLGVGRHVAQGHLGAALALQTGEHIFAGEVLHVRAVDGGDEAAHLQTQLLGGAAGVDLGDAGIAGGVLHHVHAHAHDVAALHFQQFGVLFGGVVGGVAVTGAQDIAVADHVEEGGILDVAIVIGAHVFVQLGQLGVHAFLLLHRGDGLIEDLPRQDHGHREGDGHGDDGDGKRQADADFFVHGLSFRVRSRTPAGG